MAHRQMNEVLCIFPRMSSGPELNLQVNLMNVGERYEAADLKFEFTVEVKPR